ncbi:MAG: RNA polymerase sigma factor [Candidatus Limnocylindria bacterium]
MPEPAGATDVIETSELTDATEARADFDARFAMARERLLRITASLVGATDAEDVVQDTYLLGRTGFDQLRDGAAFEPWITRIAVNVCFGRHRRMKRLRELLPALLPRKAPASDIGLRELVEKLPPRERTVLVLHYGHGYRLEEIAAILDLTHTNVRTVIARTRKRLYTAWRRAEGLDR